MKHLIMNKGLLILTLAIVGCGQSNSMSSTDDAAAEANAAAAAQQLNKMGPQLDKVKSVSEVEAHRCSDDRHKIYICHIPPGNPSQRHTLEVGSGAIAAHIKHHKAHDGSLSDYVGKCVADNPSSGGDGSSGGTDPGTGGGTDPSTGGGDLGGGTGTDPSTGGGSTGGDLGTGGGSTGGSDFNDPWYNNL